MSFSSAPPALIIRPCTPEDVPDLVAIYFSAFQDAISHKCFPRTPVVRKWWEDMLHDEITNQPGAHFLKVMRPAETLYRNKSEIVAFGKWVYVEEGNSNSEEELPAWPDDPDSDHKLAATFFGALAQKHSEIMQGKSHWYLEMIATKPEAQGLGAARKIIQWGIQRSGEDGPEGETQTSLPCYLEASPSGKRVFEKEGFEVAGDVLSLEIDGEVYEEAFMVRYSAT